MEARAGFQPRQVRAPGRILGPGPGCGPGCGLGAGRAVLGRKNSETFESYFSFFSFSSKGFISWKMDKRLKENMKRYILNWRKEKFFQ